MKKIIGLYAIIPSLSLSFSPRGPWALHGLLKRAVHLRNTKAGLPSQGRPTRFSHFTSIARATPHLFVIPSFKVPRWHGIPCTPWNENKNSRRRRRRRSPRPLRYKHDDGIRCGVCARHRPYHKVDAIGKPRTLKLWDGIWLMNSLNGWTLSFCYGLYSWSSLFLFFK